MAVGKEGRALGLVPLWAMAAAWVAALLVAGVSAREESESILMALINSKYTQWVRLLEEADLLGPLDAELQSSKAGLTIFAPSDHYLTDKVSPDVMHYLRQPQNMPVLRNVLLHHMVPGKLGVEDWSPASHSKVETYGGGGSEAYLYVEEGRYRVDSATISEFNVLDAKDGVLHELNAFLISAKVQEAAESLGRDRDFDAFVHRRSAQEVAPPGDGSSSDQLAPAPAPSTSPPGTPPPPPTAVNLTAQIIAALDSAGNYSSLAAVLTRLGLFEYMEDGVAAGQLYTLFAPDDAAFAAQQAFLDGLTLSQLTEAVLYHVVEDEEARYSYTDLLARGEDTVTPPEYEEPPAPLVTLLRNTATGNATLVVTAVNGVVYVSGIALLAGDIFVGDAVSVQGIESLLVAPTQAAPSPSAGTPPPPALVVPAAPPPPSSGLQLVAAGLGPMAALAMCLLSFTLGW